MLRRRSIDMTSHRPIGRKHSRPMNWHKSIEDSFRTTWRTDLATEGPSRFVITVYSHCGFGAARYDSPCGSPAFAFNFESHHGRLPHHDRLVIGNCTVSCVHARGNP